MIRPLAVATVLCLLPTVLGAQPPAIAAAATTKATAFVPQVAASNHFEIESSEHMIARSPTREVREFAQRMLNDHTLAATKFKQALADAKLVTPSQELDARHQAMMSKLKAANGDALDKAYIEAQYATHMDAVELFRAYARDGDTPRLKAFAADLLPTLEGHLAHVKDMQR